MLAFLATHSIVAALAVASPAAPAVAAPMSAATASELPGAFVVPQARGWGVRAVGLCSAGGGRMVC